MLDKNISKEQLNDFLNDNLIVIDDNDKVLGKKSKLECHLMSNINDGLIHRGFSVLLYNSENKFLLTERADSKITFPSCFTNACCSHPLYQQDEMEDKGAIGIKRAAKRRMVKELGIDENEIDLDDMAYTNRFMYKAKSNDMWGEHEICYLLIIKKDYNLNINPNEVKSHRYVSKDELKKLYGNIFFKNLKNFAID